MRSLTATLLRRFLDALLLQMSHSLHPESEGMSAARTRYSIVTSIRRSAAMTHGVTDRHPAHTLRRCATSHSLPSFRRARGMSAARTRYFIATPFIGAQRCRMGSPVATLLKRFGDATTPKESLSAPGERGDVRSADTLSVNPGLRPGQSNQRSMHRNAVPLRHKLVFAFWIKPAAPRKNRSKLHFSLGLH